MSWIQRVLKRFDGPDDVIGQRAEMRQARAEVVAAVEKVKAQNVEAHRLVRFFAGQYEHDHLAERLRDALDPGR